MIIWPVIDLHLESKSCDLNHSFCSFSRYDAFIIACYHLALMYHRRLFVSSEADNSLSICISDAKPRGGLKIMTPYLDASSLQNTQTMNKLSMKYSCLLWQCIFEFLVRYLTASRADLRVYFIVTMRATAKLKHSNIVRDFLCKSSLILQRGQIVN